MHRIVSQLAPPRMHSPRDNINTNLTVSIRKNVNNALKDLWIIEEPTDIVESINALEGEVRKELGDVTGLLAVLFVLGSPAHGDEWLNECETGTCGGIGRRRFGLFGRPRAIFWVNLRISSPPPCSPVRGIYTSSTKETESGLSLHHTSRYDVFSVRQ